MTVRHNAKFSRRRGAFLFLLCALLRFADTSFAGPGDTNRIEAAEIEIAFGPTCEKMLIGEIDRAEKEVLVAIYSFTRRSISGALARAAARGARVHVKYDAVSGEWPGMIQVIGYLKKRDVVCTAIAMKNEYAKMHEKFTVIDGKSVVTGSYNYTTAGSTANYENAVLIRSEHAAALFIREFNSIKSAK